MDRFIANGNQKDAIISLMYWVQENSYCKERKELEDYETDHLRENIDYCFDLCDEYGVPYWVQNEAMFYAEDWRKYCDTYHEKELAKKEIYI